MTDPDSGFEVLDDLADLRARLTRGGLAPEAVEKAAEAYAAGELCELEIGTINMGTPDEDIACWIPGDLLRKVFPTINRSSYLEYEINRHRGGRKSLTVRSPDGDEDEDASEPQVIEMPPKETRNVPEQRTAAATKGTPNQGKDASFDNDEGDPWPEDEI